MNEMGVVFGFFVLMALLVSRILRDQRRQKNRTLKLKKGERARGALLQRAAAVGSPDRCTTTEHHS